MTSSEERLKILKMIAGGVITPEEGDKLLEALAESGKSFRRSLIPEPINNARWIRIKVTNAKTGQTKATVNLPLRLMDAGLNIASQYAPGIAFNELVDAINTGVQGKIIDVMDEEDDEHVEIFIDQ